MELFGTLGLLTTTSSETGSAVKAWPFYLALGIWLVVVLLHGMIQVWKERRPDAG